MLISSQSLENQCIN
uniref:Uncharacterized protein n=1 Tax=Arundo donax TaxID=35708 RepID=A0A0A8Z4S1_ARUDO